MLTIQEAAARLDGNEYRDEGSPELFAEMDAAGLVAVFGGSDNLIEFRGAIHDEVGADRDALITRDGLLTSECDEGEECPYFKKLAKGAAKIEVLFAEEEGYTFTYRTEIPHVHFEIIESDGPEDDSPEKYCRGIVFALSDVPA